MIVAVEAALHAAGIGPVGSLTSAGSVGRR